MDNFCSLDAPSKTARAGARNFWGCDGYLPEFPQTCPKSFLCDFCLQIFSHKDHQVHFLALFVFLQTYGAVFWSQTTLGPFLTKFSRIFIRSLEILLGTSGILHRFSEFFSQNFKDFAQIFDKSKLLGVSFHPLHPASYTAVKTFGFSDPSIRHVSWVPFHHSCLWHDRKNATVVLATEVNAFCSTSLTSDAAFCLNPDQTPLTSGRRFYLDSSAGRVPMTKLEPDVRSKILNTTRKSVSDVCGKKTLRKLTLIRELERDGVTGGFLDAVFLVLREDGGRGGLLVNWTLRGGLVYLKKAQALTKTLFRLGNRSHPKNACVAVSRIV